MAKTFTKCCKECGSSFTREAATSAKAGVFCATECRKAYNNRRAVRGATMYDLVMALRYERAAANEADAWKLLCRLAEECRNEDHAERAGRQSWRKLDEVVEENVRLTHTLRSRTRAGR